MAIGEPTHALDSAVLDAVFQNAPLGLAVWDADLRYRRVNAALAAMNGRAADDHLGRRLSEVVPGIALTLEPVLRRILATGEPVHDLELTGETQAAPGTLRSWRSSFFPVLDDDRHVVGVGGIVIEVTAEREATARAEEAQQRTRAADAQLGAVYEALPLGVAFITADGTYARVNATMAQMNGRSLGEHIGRTPREVLPAFGDAVEALLEQVMRTREPVEVHFEVPTAEFPAEERALEAAFFPVFTAEEDMLGVGAVVRDVTERRRREAERAQLLQDALDARAAAEEAERRTRLLLRAGQVMARSIDYETTLQAVARAAVPDIADWCAVTLTETGGTLRVLALAAADPERERAAREMFERYPPGADTDTGVGRVIATGEPQLIAEITEETLAPLTHDDEHLRRMLALEPASAVIAPLSTPFATLGALSVVRSRGRAAFTDTDVGLVRALAQRAALHIANARLHTERSHIARTLQASLRPRALPDVPGLDAGARFRAAGAENVVGGDFYDLFPARDDVWVSIMGDVAGKGAEAAALTSLVRHTLRTASLVDVGPARNLALLNDAMLAQADDMRFCTAVYACLRPDERGWSTSLAVGGHPSPLIVRAGGQVDTAPGSGPLIGAFRAADFESCPLALGPGDALVLYTDGVTDVRRSDPDLGQRELCEVLAACAGRSADETAGAVERRAVELQGGDPRDDIAVLVLRVPPRAGA